MGFNQHGNASTDTSQTSGGDKTSCTSSHNDKIIVIVILDNWILPLGG
jgi:hypothetical protein